MAVHYFFPDWLLYIAQVMHFGATPPTANAYRIALTNNLTITPNTTKAQIACAEVVGNGYARRPYNPASVAYDSTEFRVELATVNQEFPFTATTQWSSTVIWANSPSDTPSRTVASVDATLNRLTVTGHGLTSGAEVAITSTGTLPAPLATNTSYFAQVIDANTIALHPTSALAGAIDLTTTGTGTHTLRLAGGRLMLYCNQGTQSVGANGIQPVRKDVIYAPVGNIVGSYS